MNEMIRVAAVQQAYRDDKQANLQHNIEGIRAAAAAGARLVVFPEAFVSAYPRGLDFGAVVGSRNPPVSAAI